MRERRASRLGSPALGGSIPESGPVAALSPASGIDPPGAGRRPRATASPRGIAVCFFALSIALTAGRAGARVLPEMAPLELTLAAGSTLGVNGAPGSGGAAASLGLAWPFAKRWAFGGALFAQDLGTGFTDLRDPNTGALLGTVAGIHRWSFGGEWRAEATLRQTRRLRWLWGAGFGYGREERDQRGEVNDAVSGVTASTAGTVLWQSPNGQALGASVAYRQAFVDREADRERPTRWVTATLEWRWRAISKD